ncbi:hypothetical protein [Bradyrhizobium prioriisuperbiae]|uniref:hypothetical protein n=1 Tax=Bradyrhizobium prioriisuperbiae TaxID=2854389 RepID=UPI0028E95432|nr:hypothetical protein [Bradyrhizobium prioritasuperba]
MSDRSEARRSYLNWSRKIKDMLRRERPADCLGLLSPPEVEYGADSIIVVTYRPFPLWLYRFDPSLIRNLDVNIWSYRSQRDRHIRGVFFQLDQILKRQAGTALLREIIAADSTVKIFPYWNFGKTPYRNKNPIFPQWGPNATAGATRSGTAVIEYTASMWGPVTYDPATHLVTGTSGKTGVGVGADEVLFHELVHASRAMRGVRDFDDPPAMDEGYGDEEEFIAVVLSNIYLAEKGSRQLRANHQAFTPLLNPETFLNRGRHMRVLERFRSEQRDFFNRLRDIPATVAWWNPIREGWPPPLQPAPRGGDGPRGGQGPHPRP